MTTYIVYPEKRYVSDDQVGMWYGDAVANCQCPPGARTLAEMLSSLEDAGIITVAEPPDEYDEPTYSDADYAEYDDDEPEEYEGRYPMYYKDYT